MYLIIHNPLSFNRKSKKTTAKIVKFFQKNNIPFNLRSTFKIDDLAGFLKANPTITDVVYCGGDGTINYMINHVNVTALKPNIHLAQSGSGNDFLRSLKPLKKANITIGEAKTDAGTVKFINGCGLGVDAAVCHYVNADKHKNKLSYFINAFKGMSTFVPMQMTVEVDGVVHHYEKTFFAAIQNGRYFGGGMKIAPDADPSTDTYKVVIGHSLSRALISFLFMTIYSGSHVKLKKYVTILEGKHIKVSVDSPQYFQADGEVMENVSSLTIDKVQSREFAAFDKKSIIAANLK